MNAVERVLISHAKSAKSAKAMQAFSASRASGCREFAVNDARGDKPQPLDRIDRINRI